jgi:hypothetical protein
MQIIQDSMISEYELENMWEFYGFSTKLDGLKKKKD